MPSNYDQKTMKEALDALVFKQSNANVDAISHDSIEDFRSTRDAMEGRSAAISAATSTHAVSYPRPSRSFEPISSVTSKVTSMRCKIDDLITGEISFMTFISKQTVREMIRELRRDIRKLKDDNNYTEMDIINEMEEDKYAIPF